jgi:hypothetical protein
MVGYAHLALPGELEAAGVVEGATEWFPPPRFLVDPDGESSKIYVASGSAGMPGHPTLGFLLLEEYVEERAQLFVTAFQNAQ